MPRHEVGRQPFQLRSALDGDLSEIRTDVAAEFLADQLTKRLPGIRFLPIDLTYLLRSGEPDVYDKHMAIYYANLVMSQVESGTYGVMVAHRDGAFISTDIPSKDLPARRVDPADYHTTRYRPRFEHITGLYRPQK